MIEEEKKGLFEKIGAKTKNIARVMVFVTTLTAMSCGSAEKLKAEFPKETTFVSEVEKRGAASGMTHPGVGFVEIEQGEPAKMVTFNNEKAKQTALETERAEINLEEATQYIINNLKQLSAEGFGSPQERIQQKRGAYDTVNAFLNSQTDKQATIDALTSAMEGLKQGDLSPHITAGFLEALHLGRGIASRK